MNLFNAIHSTRILYLYFIEWVILWRKTGETWGGGAKNSPSIAGISSQRTISHKGGWKVHSISNPPHDIIKRLSYLSIYSKHYLKFPESNSKRCVKFTADGFGQRKDTLSEGWQRKGDLSGLRGANSFKTFRKVKQALGNDP